MRMQFNLLAAGIWLIGLLAGALQARSQTSILYLFPAQGITAYEAPTNFLLGVVLVGSSSGTVTVDYATSNQTATAGLDYVAQSGTLTFGLGETNKFFSIPILADSLVEGEETLLVALSNPTGGAALSPTNTIVLTIFDRTTVLEFSQNNFTVNEQDGSTTINVTRTGVWFDSVSVQYATGDGTATAGMDYTAQSGTLTFAFGETFKSFAVPITNDNLVEPNETVNLVLSNPSPGSAMGNQQNATITILGQDSVVEFSALNYEVNEFGGSAMITLIRIPAGSNSGWVNFATSDGTAAAGLDYWSQSGSVYFSSGQSTQTFIVPILEDALSEASETVTLTLTGAVGGIGVGTQRNAELTILNAAVAVEFASADISVGENAGSALVTLRRRGDAGLAFTVDYATSTNGTGVAGLDYTPQSGTIPFAAGETNKTISFPVLDDPLVDGDKTVQLALENPSGGVVLGAQQEALLRIQDNEKPVVVDPSFDPGVGPDGIINSLAVQSDGRIIVAGYFTTVNGVSRNRIARLNTNGSLDPSFNAGFVDGTINSVALTGGKVLIGGHFTTVNGVSRNHIARLNADGTLDSSFQLGLAGLEGGVHSFVAQSDGKVVVGGFSTVSSGIARLNPDGVLDRGFQPGLFAIIPSGRPCNGGYTNASVRSITVQSDGKVVVGGSFVPVHDNICYDHYVARLNADGTLDSSFQNGLGVNSFVQSIALQSDGKVLAGGYFGIARLQVDGTLEGGFQNALSAANSSVNSIAVQIDGKVLVGGDFTTVHGISRYRIARLNADGSLDASFNAGLVDGTITSVGLTGGKVLIGGSFTTVNGITRNRIARLYADSANLHSLEFASPGYGVGESGGVAAIIVERAGESSGTFTIDYATANGTATAGLDYTAQSGTLTFGPLETVKTISIPILDDGLVEGDETVNVTLSNPSTGVMLGALSKTLLTIQDTERPVVLDGTFSSVSVAIDQLQNPGTILTLATQTDGKLLIGGDFNLVNGVSRLRLARLNTDGSLDESFNPRVGQNGEAVYSLAVQTDGRILVGGVFSLVNGVSRNNIARLNADGSVDTSFNPDTGANGLVRYLATQADGKLLVVGEFTGFNGTTRNRICRLNADGSLDTSFNPGIGPNSGVNTFAVQPDGKLLIGGSFSAVNGISRNRIAQLNADGTLDSLYSPGTGANDVVNSLVLQSNGKVVIAGYFTMINGANRYRVARLNADGSLDTGFDAGFLDGGLNSVALQPDGKVFVAGYFNAINNTSRRGIARLNPDGTLDRSFNAGAGAFDYVNALTLQPDGTLLISAAFTDVNGIPHNGVFRIFAESAAVSAFGFVSSGAVREVDGTATVTVERYGDATQPVSVEYTTRDDSAIAALDYTAQGGTLAFGPLEAFKTITIPILDDGLVESDERLHVLLRNQSAGSVLGQASAPVNILDNERPGSLDLSFSPPTDFSFSDYFSAGTPGSIILVQADSRSLIVSPNQCALTRVNADGSLDTRFNPTVNGCIYSAALQNGEKIVIGGSFTRVAGSSRTNVARLNTDGSLDTSFSTDARTDGEIFALAAQTDGALVLAGNFGRVNGVSRSWLARLHANGSLDNSFQPNVDMIADPGSLSLALQSNGKILVQGYLNFTNGSGGYGLFRLNSDGSLDATFFSSVQSARVNTIAAQPDGKILLAGGFTAVNGVTEPGIARLDANGSLDESFDVIVPFQVGGWGSVSSVVRIAALQPDAKVLVGGDFSQVNGLERRGIARLNSDGSLDTSFDPGTGTTDDYGLFGPAGRVGRVNAIGLGPDGKVAIGGAFTSVNGVARPGFARLNGDGSIATGSIDFEFASFSVSEVAGTAIVMVRRIGNTNAAITVEYTLSNGSATSGTDYLAQTGRLSFAAGETTKSIIIPILSEGLVESDETVSITLSNPTSATLGVQTTATLRILDSERPGGLDFGFDPNLELSGAINAVVVLTDGRIVIGGTFTSVSGVSLAGIARLNPDGSLDPGFNPGTNWFDPLNGLNPDVTAMAVESNGNLLVASPNYGLVRLNAAGTVDLNFTWGFSTSLAAQRDGKILVGDGYSITRLSASGAAEATFAVPIPAGYESLTAQAAQADGKILAAVRSGGIPMVVRLNSNGSPDTNFLAEPLSPVPFPAPQVSSLAVQADGKILLGGTFTSVGGIGRNGIARLNADGFLDTTFDPGTGAISSDTRRNVTSVTSQPDGGILIAGRFAVVNGIRRNGLARLNGDPPLQFTAVAAIPGGPFRFTLVTLPGKTYVLEHSSDLLNWSQVSTNTATNFWLEFEDTSAPSFAHRFYRVVAP